MAKNKDHCAQRVVGDWEERSPERFNTLEGNYNSHSV